MYFYTPATLEKMINKAGMHVAARFDLPGHQIGSPNLWPRFLTRMEFAVLKALRKLTANRFDLRPHFVLLARPNKSNIK
jgi:hypothetical protein